VKRLRVYVRYRCVWAAIMNDWSYDDACLTSLTREDLLVLVVATAIKKCVWGGKVCAQSLCKMVRNM
jgi:hypothetical protein